MCLFTLFNMLQKETQGTCVFYQIATWISNAEGTDDFRQEIWEPLGSASKSIPQPPVSCAPLEPLSKLWR